MQRDVGQLADGDAAARPRQPQSEVLLDVHEVSKRYGQNQALREVSFDLRAGEIHALVGHNGAGKSTLVKILSGVTRPDSGTVTIDGSVCEPESPQQAQRHGVAFVDQELSLVPCLSVEDNIVLGDVRAPFLRRSGSVLSSVRRLLDGLGLSDVSPRTLVGDLGLGDRQLVEIARALNRDARILILDEPTATLSEAETRRVFQAVRNVAAEGHGVIFVSHRLGEVLGLCDRITVFRDGRRVAVEEPGSLDAARLGELIMGEMGKMGAPRDARPPLSAVDGPTVLAMQGLSVPGRVAGFDLEVRRGQIVGLAGQVGSGASDILRALVGLAPDATGSVTVDGQQYALASPRRSVRAGATYASADRKGEGLFLDRSVDDNLVATRLTSLTRSGFLDRARRASVATRARETVGVAADRATTPARELSGGNQQKVFLGRCLNHRDSKLLLLDEPTRGVDVGGRSEIHKLIRGAARDGQAVLFVSTDVEEIMELSDTIVTLFGGRRVRAASRSDITIQQVLADTTHGVELGESGS